MSSSCFQNPMPNAFDATIRQKRSYVESEDSYMDNGSQWDAKKRLQTRKITTEQHDKTVAIMMQASKELSRRERLCYNLALLRDGVEDGPVEKEEGTEDHEEGTVRSTQEPFWPQLIRSAVMKR
ncbi:DEKNAAC102655 [Brettanomyces naardenensis]|uniref:DEKNAAC102656 n=1 Tax=Brettanomyces naardenensis TaxID=13370 RepID=A0A448YK72_BRENA|nr:DEKNAAC102655 [Brettanomyces naardenensis]